MSVTPSLFFSIHTKRFRLCAVKRLKRKFSKFIRCTFWWSWFTSPTNLCGKPIIYNASKFHVFIDVCSKFYSNFFPSQCFAVLLEIAVGATAYMLVGVRKKQRSTCKARTMQYMTHTCAHTAFEIQNLLRKNVLYSCCCTHQINNALGDTWSGICTNGPLSDLFKLFFPRKFPFLWSNQHLLCLRIFVIIFI